MSMMRTPAIFVGPSEAAWPCPRSDPRVAGCGGSSPCVRPCLLLRIDSLQLGRVDAHTGEYWREIIGMSGGRYRNGRVRCVGWCRLMLSIYKWLCGSSVGPSVSSLLLVLDHSLRMRNINILIGHGREQRPFISGLPSIYWAVPEPQR